MLTAPCPCLTLLARLQHSLDVSVSDDNLIIADSYNGILMSFNLIDLTLSDFDAGTYTCTDNICIPGAEPVGVSTMPDGRNLMVDTNNHHVIAYNPSDLTYGTWAQ
jgi:hypothetical protein